MSQFSRFLSCREFVHQLSLSFFLKEGSTFDSVKSRDNSPGRQTGLGLAESRFSFIHSVHAGSGVHITSHTLSTLWKNQPEREADHSSAPTTEVKMVALYSLPRISPWRCVSSI